MVEGVTFLIAGMKSVGGITIMDIRSEALSVIEKRLVFVGWMIMLIFESQSKDRGVSDRSLSFRLGIPMLREGDDESLSTIRVTAREVRLLLCTA